MATTKPAKRKPNAAFMKPVQPDDVLAAVVGAKPLPRTELTKKLWEYIKKNGLQDKKVKTQINADDKLKPVFGGKKSVSMFEMTKLASRNPAGTRTQKSPAGRAGLTVGDSHAVRSASLRGEELQNVVRLLLGGTFVVRINDLSILDQEGLAAGKTKR
jgi:hypothetical protein